MALWYSGATPSIGSVVDAISDERDTIGKKLNFSPIPSEPFYEQILGARWPQDPCEVGPPSLRHRYISEDIPYGLVPLAYLGNLLNVPTPVSDAIIELSSITNNVNYWKAGLTLEKLKLDRLSPAEILKLVNEGEKQKAN
jgi:opine dehydrogenase